MKKVILSIVIGLPLMVGSVQAESLETAINNSTEEIKQNPKYLQYIESTKPANMEMNSFINSATLCNMWLIANPIWKLQGLNTGDCFSNVRAPWFRMQQDFLPSLKLVDNKSFKPKNIIEFDPYDVGNGKFVCSFAGKIIQRLNKNSYILVSTNLSGQDVPFYLTNVPAGNYQIGSFYIGYTQKGQPYKYKAANGALQIVNAGNKVYSITEFQTLEKMIRSGM